MKKILLTFLTIICFSGLNFAQTTFAPRQNIDPATGNRPTFVVSGDLDGDTFIDIAIGSYDYIDNLDYIKWYQNDGSGNFTLQPPVSESVVWVQGLIIADIDITNNNGNDLVATAAVGSKLVYYANDGAGGFGPEVIISSTIADPGQVVSGDINNDGFLDLAVVSYTNNETIWFMGDGLGGFVEQTTSPIQTGGSGGPWYMDMADFDGDSDLDALVGFYNSGNVEIYYNQYTESGTSTVSWIKDAVSVATGNSFLSVPTQQMGFADVNNDGIMDVIKLNNSTGAVQWYSKIVNGTSTPNTISTGSIIARPGTVVVDDLNNDGNNDVILTDGGSADDSIIWFEGASNANPSSTELVIDNNNFQYWAISVNDFNGDSNMDIAAVGVFSKTLDWYENIPSTIGVHEFTNNSFSIYPNPTSDYINFKGLTSETINVSVFDVLGKEVLNQSVNLNEMLDVSKLQKGLYVLKLNDSNTAYKFIKE